MYWIQYEPRTEKQQRTDGGTQWAHYAVWECPRCFSKNEYLLVYNRKGPIKDIRYAISACLKCKNCRAEFCVDDNTRPREICECCNQRLAPDIQRKNWFTATQLTKAEILMGVPEVLPAQLSFWHHTLLT